MAEDMTKIDDIKKEEELSINQRTFLAAYSRCGNKTEAQRLSEVDKSNHYKWIKESELYKYYFELAEEEAADYLETEARRRAVEGVQEPIFYQGFQCGTITKYSDTLLMFLMKGANSEKYAERNKNYNENKNENQNYEHSQIDYSKLTDEELSELEHIIAKTQSKPDKI